MRLFKTGRPNKRSHERPTGWTRYTTFRSPMLRALASKGDIMTDKDSYWRFVDPIWDTVSIYDGGDTFLEQISKVTEKQKVLFSSHWAQSEICNGGLHQFFSNSTGVLAPEAVEAFKVIGMPTCSNVIADAMKFFGKEYLRDRNQRDEKLAEYENQNDEHWDPFCELDNIFFDSIEEENGGFEIAADNYANQG